MTNPVLTITDIHNINELAYKHSMTNEAIADELGIPLEDVTLVLLRRYVADVEFKADEDITLADYEAIRKKFTPGKRSPYNEYALCREFGIDPQTVNDIAHGRFYNANTHPSRYAEPETAETVEAVTERVMDADDVARGMKLLGMGWPVSDIAADLGIDASRVSKLKVCKLNGWGTADALSLVNRGL
ncbi:hypothetical protein ACVFDQ_002755 [Enterobacter hormaechei]